MFRASPKYVVGACLIHKDSYHYVFAEPKDIPIPIMESYRGYSYFIYKHACIYIPTVNKHLSIFMI